MLHDYHDLITLFNGLFANDCDTILVAGEQEPIYLPKGEGERFHRIIFAHGFYQSALHEISHWCIAGSKRRLLEDYGYWYEPDGRSLEQQKIFEKVEIKPQALEWLFSVAAGIRFNVSADNLNGESSSSDSCFKTAIASQAKQYLTLGVNERAEKMIKALNKFYKTSYPAPSSFNLELIQ